MKKTLIIIALILGTLCGPMLFKAAKVSALSGADFQAGKIIDDGVFFNPNTIDPNTIQVFLNSKVPNCDTNGVQSYGGTTRAAYGTSRGYPPPYTCLRNYTQDTPTKAADGLCNQYNGGAKSGARIIYDVGQACGINPKALVVLLEKEQSLVTDDWPWSIQYRSATGYGCPDTAPCDSEYYGFFNQVYNAARQFKRYARDANLFAYKAGRINYIQYNPNASCGGSNVLIQNQATAGLYNYTPYQPNASALATIYGSGDSCSAYGNRNFWRLFNEWFGSTNTNCYLPPQESNAVYRLYNRGTGNHLLTTDVYEVCAATAIGYLYDGVPFSQETTNGVPVYRLENGGRYLYTASTAERDAAIGSYGYRLEGVGFYGVNQSLDPSSARAVYRLSAPNGTFTYTISLYERDRFVDAGYSFNGIAFYLKENPGASVVPLYRLASNSGIYLFTASDDEKNNAVSVYGYRYEGIGFNAINRLNTITTPVYRLASNSGYVLTTSLIERIAATRIGYRDEGVGFYTYGATTDPNLNKVYRLSNSRGSYLYTTSAAERDAAVNNYGYRLEGIGFLAP